MATENLQGDRSIPYFQRPTNGGSLDTGGIEKISPEYLNEWKERTFRKEVFDLFIEYFCVRQRVPFKELIDSVEKSILLHALAQCNGNQRSAAEFLGMKYTTLNEKLKRFNIQFAKRPF
jgi:DNA-binding NtrC family response regulator